MSHGVWLHVCVMSLNGVNNLRTLTMATSKIRTNYSVDLNPWVNCLYHIMSRPARLGWSRLKAKLFSHNAAKYWYLNRVSKNILDCKKYGSEAYQSLYDLRMKIVNTTIKCSLPASLNTLVNKSLSLLGRALTRAG